MCQSTGLVDCLLYLAKTSLPGVEQLFIIQPADESSIDEPLKECIGQRDWSMVEGIGQMTAFCQDSGHHDVI